MAIDTSAESSRGYLVTALATCMVPSVHGKKHLMAAVASLLAPAPLICVTTLLGMGWNGVGVTLRVEEQSLRCHAGVTDSSIAPQIYEGVH